MDWMRDGLCPAASCVKVIPGNFEVFWCPCDVLELRYAVLKSGCDLCVIQYGTVSE